MEEVLTAQELRWLFEEELAKLQERCTHPRTDWIPHHWAIGHSSGHDVLFCYVCEGHIKVRYGCLKCLKKTKEDEVFSGVYWCDDIKCRCHDKFEDCGHYGNLCKKCYDESKQG